MRWRPLFRARYDRGFRDRARTGGYGGSSPRVTTAIALTGDHAGGEVSGDRSARPGTPAHSSAQPEAPGQPRLSAGRMPPPAPREADDRVVTGTITAGWAVALIVVGALAACGVLPAREQWWVWTCAAGLCMGLFGLWYVPTLKRGRARAAARRAESPDDETADAQPFGQLSAEPSSESRESGSKTVSSTETPGSSTRS